MTDFINIALGWLMGVMTVVTVYLITHEGDDNG